MRRGLAGLLLGVSLVVASLTWAGFVINHTVLDPDRSERLADQVLENETLRSALITRLSESLGNALPAGVTIPGQQLDAIAAVALDDPRVEALVRDGIVRTHQNALNGVDEPVVLNASALTESARSALVAARPELDASLPEGPSIEVELPTTGLSWLGKLRGAIQRLVVFGFILAITGGTVSLVVAKNRPAVLRRVAFWAFGASAFWLAVSYLVPWLAAQVGPTSTAVATAMTDVLFSAMIRPALLLAVFGAGLLALAAIISIANDRKPAKVLQPAGAADPTMRQAPSGPGPTTNGHRATPPSQQTRTDQPHRSGPATPTAPPPQRPPAGAADQTRVFPRPRQPQAYPGTAATQPDAPRPVSPPPTSPSTAPQPQPKPHPEARRWVEGVGYTDESPDRG